MRREDFKAILVWWKRLKIPEMVNRELTLPAAPVQVISVVGVRRCGKTYLILNTTRQLLGELGKDNVVYVNFEHERLRNMDAGDLGELLVAQREIFEPDETKPIYMFLDEIQNVRDWDKWVRRIHDERRFRIFITGSSSKLLSREIATSLRGRCLSFTLYPFSFAEFLRAKRYPIESLAEVQYSEEKGRVLKLLREYMEFGGFPEVVLEGDEEMKGRLLSSYFETIFYKDIVERYGVKNLALLDGFLRYAINNFSSYLSLSKVEKYFKSTGVRCSKKTLANFLKYSEAVFLLFPVEVFSYGVKDRMQYPRKIYCVDTGIINRIAPKFRENLGKLTENVVYLDLRRRFEPPTHEIFYWRNRQLGEVDFAVKEGMRVKRLIQVCWDPSDEETRRRELRGLLKAMEEFKLKEGLVLTGDFEGEENESFTDHSGSGCLEGELMRILMASDLFYPFLLGGGETRMYEVARRLAKKHEIHVLTRRFKGLPSYEVHEGVHIHRVFVPSARIKLESPADGSAFMAGALLKGLNLGDFDLYAPQQFFPIFPLWLIERFK